MRKQKKKFRIRGSCDTASHFLRDDHGKANDQEIPDGRNPQDIESKSERLWTAIRRRSGSLEKPEIF